VHLGNFALAHRGATVSAGPRLIFGVNEHDHSIDTPLATNGDNHLALYVQAEALGTVSDDNNPSRFIAWNADTIIYSGPSPYLEVALNGTVQKAINISVDGFSSPMPGIALSPNANVGNIINNDVGDIYMQSNGGTIGNTTNEPTFSFRENYELVTIINRSSLQLETNNIQVINPNAQPTVTLNAPGGTTQNSTPFFLIVQ